MDVIAPIAQQFQHAFAYQALTDDAIRLVTILPAPNFNDPI